MDIQQKIESLPKNPGVYIMRGKKGEILYVGKAKVLSSRVRSYFHSGRDQSPRVRSMVGQVNDIETLVTASELEALILENNLIKKHRPRYNVILRDDKNYPLLRLPIKDDFPRLEIVRKIKDDGALYFGPYVPAGGLHEMIRLLRRIFPLPNCSIVIDGTADRACLEFEIKRCLAPCTGNQSKEEYGRMIAQVRLFLEGRDKMLLRALRKRMQQRAESLDFEAAARIRDQVMKIERALEHQRITSVRMEDRDVIGFSRKGEALDIQVLFVRGGKLVGRKDFFLDRMGETPDEELCTGFLQQFYNKEGIIPKKIMIPLHLRDRAILETWLSGCRSGVVRLLTPSRGKGLALLRLARENAESSLDGHLKLRAGGETKMELLQELLKLKSPPYRIEGYDISNIMGTSAVGSMVVFERGKSKRSDYRHFRIKTVEGANDFAMMAEVLSRRMNFFKEKPGTSPDLILIDGGKGQISAVESVLEKLHPGSYNLIGLAKEKGERGERVYLPHQSDPITLPVASPATHLLMQVRDEAHRFAVSYHRKVRSKKMLSSRLQEVEGIGKQRSTALLRHFGSLSKIEEASLEDLEKAPSMNRGVAKQLYESLHK
ncbi:MAG: excinuclease ABC subunit UvrC [Nitrospiria bacterium]